MMQEKRKTNSLIDTLCLTFRAEGKSTHDSTAASYLVKVLMDLPSGFMVEYVLNGHDANFQEVCRMDFEPKHIAHGVASIKFFSNTMKL